jgi:hypothetical protein
MAAFPSGQHLRWRPPGRIVYAQAYVGSGVLPISTTNDHGDARH